MGVNLFWIKTYHNSETPTAKSFIESFRADFQKFSIHPQGRVPSSDDYMTLSIINIFSIMKIIHIFANISIKLKI